MQAGRSVSFIQSLSTITKLVFIAMIVYLFSKTVTQNQRVKKGIQKLLKENELAIVIQCNTNVVNYLDVTLNL